MPHVEGGQMKKITRIGWMPKTDRLNIEFSQHDFEWHIPCVFPKRGNKDYYTSEDYPPRKVRITVEEVA